MPRVVHLEPRQCLGEQRGFLDFLVPHIKSLTVHGKRAPSPKGRLPPK